MWLSTSAPHETHCKSHEQAKIKFKMVSKDLTWIAYSIHTTPFPNTRYANIHSRPNLPCVLSFATTRDSAERLSEDGFMLLMAVMLQMAFTFSRLLRIARHKHAGGVSTGHLGTRVWRSMVCAHFCHTALESQTGGL